MVRPAVLVALILLIAPAIILTVGRSLHASGANTITVNTLLDSSVASDGVCSLREAINNANAKSDTTGGDCAAGTGNDTIAFSVSGTIAVASTLPSIANTVEIDGTGQTIVIDGGGANSILVNSGVLTLNNLTISNAATTGNGGGVQNNGNLTVTNSTFLGNSANTGGAIFNSDSGVLSVTNCTFSGNIGTSGGGGAIFTNNGGTVVSSTFSANSSVLVVNTGAAIFGNGSTITVSNSILANSIGFNCPVGQAVEVIGNGGGNISDDSSCGFGSSTGANGKTIGDSVLPLLDPSGLQNNGGPTDTIALQPNSPAVNAVPIANCLPTDQRGDPRPDPADNSGACDAGAFESIDVTATPTATATATATPDGHGESYCIRDSDWHTDCHGDCYSHRYPDCYIDADGNSHRDCHRHRNRHIDCNRDHDSHRNADGDSDTDRYRHRDCDYHDYSVAIADPQAAAGETYHHAEVIELRERQDRRCADQIGHLAQQEQDDRYDHRPAGHRAILQSGEQHLRRRSARGRHMSNRCELCPFSGRQEIHRQSDVQRSIEEKRSQDKPQGQRRQDAHVNADSDAVRDGDRDSDCYLDSNCDRDADRHLDRRDHTHCDCHRDDDRDLDFDYARHTDPDLYVNGYIYAREYFRDGLGLCRFEQSECRTQPGSDHAGNRGLDALIQRQHQRERYERLRIGIGVGIADLAGGRFNDLSERIRSR